jgi:hypothetical protein
MYNPEVFHFKRSIMNTALLDFLNKHSCLIFSLNVHDIGKVFQAEVL